MASIGIRLPEQEQRMLARIASQNDMTISQVIRKLIQEYIDGASQTKHSSWQVSAASGVLASHQEQRKKVNDI